MMSLPTSMYASEEFSMSSSRQDGLVPTTVSEHTADYDDGGYGSDDKGFYYSYDNSEKASPGVSGTSTPTTAYTEDTMEMFAAFAETWQEEMMPTTVTSQQQYNQKLDYQSTSVDNSYADDASESSQSSDAEEEGDENMPEILRRSVKGMTVEEKKLRRRELNRLAAQRSRQKKRSAAVNFEQEAKRLTKRNAELKVELNTLESAKTELYGLIKNHFKQCHTRKNTNFKNTTNNNNQNHGEHHGVKPVTHAKVEIQDMPCQVPAVPTPCSVSQTPVTVVNYDDMYQGYAGNVSGASQGYTVAYD